jgi:hypothetical protein
MGRKTAGGWDHSEPVTHEPATPINWPHGHVCVELTDADQSECVRVWIHGHMHFLHATTARELAKMLGVCLDEYNKAASEIGFPTV